MFTPKNIYSSLESKLEPAQGLVTVLLLVIIIVSAFMLFTTSNTMRTAWVTYMFMP